MEQEQEQKFDQEQAVHRIIIENYADGNVKVQFPHLPPVILMGLIEFAKVALTQQTQQQNSKVHLAPASMLNRLRKIGS